MTHALNDRQSTLPAALAHTARTAPSRGISIYDRRGKTAERKTYADLFAAANDRAARLATAGIKAGDRLLLCLPTSWELLEIYFGAIFRGALPVLVAPVGALGGAAAHAHKIGALIELLQPARFVCDASVAREMAEFGVAAAKDLLLTPEDVAALAPASGDVLHSAQPDDLAFMQLTSGSTGRQRAVMIPHRSVIHNTDAIGRFLRAPAFTDGHNCLSWLPLNHDMGLVGCLMFALTHGHDLSLLRPETFLARPKLWLQMLSAGPNMLSPAPNFAYQLCVERISPEEMAGLNLSGWRELLTGAEMIRPETCEAFRQKFEPVGYEHKRLLASYGMAEGTLAVTCDTRREGIRTRPVPAGGDSGMGLNEVVSVGTPVMDTDVKIGAPSQPGRFLDDGVIGEVCAKGPGIFRGYYNDAAATAESLHDGWLRTGDLGFIQDGELYITGRIKDLLIIHGHNLMPHELEWVAESVSGGGGTERCGAFSVARGGDGEQAVVVMEVAETGSEALAGLDREIRSRVGRTLGLPLADVVFIKRGQIPKTTSGKVQRRELKARYLDGRLDALRLK